MVEPRKRHVSYIHSFSHMHNAYAALIIDNRKVLQKILIAVILGNNLFIKNDKLESINMQSR